MKRSSLFSIILFFVSAHVATGQVVISEIMFDAEGSDTDKEWIEIRNVGNSGVDVGALFLKEANTNHKLVISRGDQNVPADGFAIIASNANKFIADNPSYGGVVFDSSFSLSNEGESLAITQKNTGGAYDILDSFTYSNTLGANGDGNSLQKSGSSFVPSKPTLGYWLDKEVSTQSVNTENTKSTPSSLSTSSSSPTNSTNSVTGGAWPVEPQLFADAGVDKKVSVGSSVVFSGSAVGIKKEPLVNAKYNWNFGDGEIKEGVNVLHTYRAEGKYVVTLTVVSGYFTAIDRLEVTAITPSIVIGEVVEGSSGYVTLINNSSEQLDISGFRINDNGNYFIIPQNTVVLGNTQVRFFNSVTKLNPEKSSVFLSYATGEMVEAKNVNVLQLASAQITGSPQKTISAQSSGFLASAKNPEQTGGDAPKGKNDINKYYAGVGESLPKRGEGQSKLWWYGALTLVIIAGGVGVITLRRINSDLEVKDEADEYELV